MKQVPLALVPLALLGAVAGFSAYAGASASCGDSYTVRRHDNLYRIALRCHSSVARISADNRIANPARIAVGQILVLINSVRMASAPRAEGAKPGEMAPRANGAGFSYQFQPQDTLFSLARWARVPVPALIAANPGVNPHKVEIGDLIRLPRGAVDPLPLRTRERGPSVAAAAPAAAPRPQMAPRPQIAPRTMPPPLMAPRPRWTPPPPRDERPPRDADEDKPDDGNLHGRNQPEGM